MAGVDVSEQLVEQVSATRVIPEVMMRVDDRELGFEDLLDKLGEPFRIRQRAAIGAGFGGHGILSAG
jgi:hypothetical protein